MGLTTPMCTGHVMLMSGWCLLDILTAADRGITDGVLPAERLGVLVLWPCVFTHVKPLLKHTLRRAMQQQVGAVLRLHYARWAFARVVCHVEVKVDPDNSFPALGSHLDTELRELRLASISRRNIIQVSDQCGGTIIRFSIAESGQSIRLDHVRTVPVQFRTPRAVRTVPVQFPIPFPLWSFFIYFSFVLWFLR